MFLFIYSIETKRVMNSEEEAREAKQAEVVLNDPELRSLLLDPHMQTILAECSDPRRFQAHMRDPVTAGRIKRLFDAGLVGTAKDVKATD